VKEAAIADDEVAVDEGVIHAPQVANLGVNFRDSKQAVLPADEIAVGANIALRTTPNREFAARKQQKMSAGLPANDFHAQLHRGSVQERCRT
jgi:hypothetical protein